MIISHPLLPRLCKIPGTGYGHLYLREYSLWTCLSKEHLAFLHYYISFMGLENWDYEGKDYRLYIHYGTPNRKSNIEKSAIESWKKSLAKRRHELV